MKRAEHGSTRPKRFDWIFEKLKFTVPHAYGFYACVCVNGKLRNLLIENGTQFVCLFSSVHLCKMPFASSKCYHHFQRVLNRSNELTKNVLANKSVSLMLTTATKKRNNDTRYAWSYKHVSCVVFIKFDFDPSIHRYLPMHDFHGIHHTNYAKSLFSPKFEIHLRCGSTKYWICRIIVSVSHWKFNLISKHLCSFIDVALCPVRSHSVWIKNVVSISSRFVIWMQNPI